MREIVVISGKGGTGKTSVCASLAHLAQNKVVCDLDVDAPDMHILLDPQVHTREAFVSGNEAVIDRDACRRCGICFEHCRFDAVKKDGDVYGIDPLRCEGCGVCVAACPRGILELTPQRGRVAVYCNTRDKLRAVMDVCDVGCIKCGKCIKTCPAKAVRLEDNRIVIDHLLCLSYGPICEEACVGTCPRHILRSTRNPLVPRAVADADDKAATPPAPEAAASEQSRPQPQA